MTEQPRKLLSRWGNLFSRDSVYQTAEGLEVDASEHYEIVRRRVFFDDVQLVTFHREYGIAYLLITAVIALFFGTIGFVILTASTQAWPAALVFFGFAAPAALMFIFRVLFGVDVISVFGRRSKAVLRFSGMRRRRAREVYGQICSTVRRVQAEAEQRTAGVPPAE